MAGIIFQEWLEKWNRKLVSEKLSNYIRTMAAKRHPLPIETRAEVIELSKAGKSER